MLCAKKWITAALCAAILAANLTMPAGSFHVLAADTQQQEASFSENTEGQTEQDGSALPSASDVVEESAQIPASEENEDAVQDPPAEEARSNGQDLSAEEPASDALDLSGEEPASDAQDLSAEEPANDADDSAPDDAAPVRQDLPDAEKAAAGQKQAPKETGADGRTIPDTEKELPVLSAGPVNQTVIPSEDCGPDTDNDDVFAGYVNRELKLDKSLQFDTGEAGAASGRMEKAFVSTRLTGHNRTIYAILLKEIKKVAAGERTNTVFTVSLQDLGLNDQYWTAAELGVDSIVEDGSITLESRQKLNEKTNISFTTINRALLADCPYDLYWYDKTIGTPSSGFGYQTRVVNGEYVLSYSSSYDYTFSFPVEAEYSASGLTETYEVNSSIGSAVQTAYETAQSIVDQNASGSDYEKLTAYKETICDLVSYNYEAAGKNYSGSYGNPWQLIWVFDNDPDTNVVCEGYAKSFQYLCDLTSWTDSFKECISVTGSMEGGTGSGGHMWNIVSFRDGTNYLTDVTNCDDGTIGDGNGRSDLFLVGTGTDSAATVYSQGNIRDGYRFPGLNDLTYVYSDDTRNRFGDEILTLSEGRINENTNAGGIDSGDHTHVDEPVEEIPESGNTPDSGEPAVTYDIKDAVVSGIVEKTYNGSEQTQTPLVQLGSASLKKGTDYTVTYSNNIKAGTDTALMILTGTGNYTGTVRKTFTIRKAAQVFTVRTAASEIDAGKTTRVTASGARENAGYTFASSNTSIAAVSSNGTVTGKAAGTVTITVRTAATANYNAGAKTVQITVKKVLKKPGNCRFAKWNKTDYSSCRIAWNKVAGAQGYQLQLAWTDGSHASVYSVKAGTLCRSCKVTANRVSKAKVRAYYYFKGVRQYSAWSNTALIIPSPARITCKNVSRGSSRKMKVSWKPVHGSQGYSIYVTTNPKGKWTWIMSTPAKKGTNSAVITKCRGKLRKNTRYYVRIVTRRKQNKVFLKVPLPKKSTSAGSFVIR